MAQEHRADVVVLVQDWAERTLRNLNHILDSSGSALNRLIVVDCTGAEPFEAQAFMQDDPRVVQLQGRTGAGLPEVLAQSLLGRTGDLAIMQCPVKVQDGWLTELAAVAHSQERTFLATSHIESLVPEKSSLATLNSQTTFGVELPRSTIIPVPRHGCCYVRGDLRDAVGPIDSRYATLEVALMDWAMRAQSLGLVCRRANRVWVALCASEEKIPPLDRAARDQSAADQQLLAQRHPQLQPQLDRFESSLEFKLVEHTRAVQTSGRLRVALDLRPLPPANVGTRIHAVSLVNALSQVEELDLTLLVQVPEQARGLPGRIVTTENWNDDVHVIHRPMQLIDPRELKLLFESSAHLVITFQDLIGYRIPKVFPTDVDHQTYQATNQLSLQAFQRILAFSENAASEIVEEFQVPREDVVVVPLGVDAARFSAKTPGDDDTFQRLNIQGRFFFSIATDFPHKNLECLLEAYAHLRADWAGGGYPALVLAGYPTASRGGLYQNGKASLSRAGVTFLGPVSDDQLRILYQRSEALIYPSLYEGFGLPLLEAMAAGTPVIAMSLSSVPEVGADCVFYPDGFSADALAHAMKELASNPELQARLRVVGGQRVKQFTWEQTGRHAFNAYRQAVLQPSERSLNMRRSLRDATLSWSQMAVQRPGLSSVITSAPGVRMAWYELHAALNRSLKRRVRRFVPGVFTRSA